MKGSFVSGSFKFSDYVVGFRAQDLIRIVFRLKKFHLRATSKHQSEPNCNRIKNFREIEVLFKRRFSYEIIVTQFPNIKDANILSSEIDAITGYFIFR